MSEYAGLSPNAPTDDVCIRPQDEDAQENIPRYYGAGGGSALDAFRAFGHHVSEEPTELLEQFERSGRVADPLGEDPLAGLTAVPNDVYKTLDSKTNVDRLINGASVVDDAGSALGLEEVSQVANMAKGGAEIGKGAAELEQGIKNDNGLQEVKAVDDLLHGVADGTSGVPEEHVGAFGKSLKAGMWLGNQAAPVVFGDNKTSSDVLLDDGTYAPSTGNRAIDWVAGTGAYSKTRFENHKADEPSADDKLNDALASEKAAEASASAEDAERLRAQKALMYQIAGVKDPDAE